MSITAWSPWLLLPWRQVGRLATRASSTNRGRGPAEPPPCKAGATDPDRSKSRLKAGAIEPDGLKSFVNKADLFKARATEPDSSKARAVELGGLKSFVIKSDASQASGTESDAARTRSIEPDATNIGSIDPHVTQARRQTEAIEADAVKMRPIEPDTVKTGAIEPDATQTQPTVPDLTQTGPIEPNAVKTAEAEAVDFQDDLALSSKSTWEILRALLVLRCCSLPLVAEHSLWLLRACRRVLGRRAHAAVMRASFYGQFVAGETPSDVRDTVGRMARSGLRALPAVPVEEDLGEARDGEQWYERNALAMRECVELSSTLDPEPMMQLKLTALLSASLCHKMTQCLQDPSTASELSIDLVTECLNGRRCAFACLTPAENAHLEASLCRLKQVGERASCLGVCVLIDAEYTHLNLALNLLALAMMNCYNHGRALVWNTYQCYLKDVGETLESHALECEMRGLWLGVKLVRGAYMETERKLAARQGRLDPVYPSWELTCHSYDNMLDRILERIGRHGDRYSIIVATHNEQSVRHAVTRMSSLGIPRDAPTVCFGQLLGMCDHVSLTLGRLGYRVYKSLPFGTVDDVMPYLSRRAQENTHVMANSRAERQLLGSELRRRMRSIVQTTETT